MKKLSLFLVLSALYSFSCNSSVRDIFGKKTPHEEYVEKLDDRGLDKTPEGRSWLAASKAALEAPLLVSMPYKQQGYFHGDKPRALGLQFSARAGEKLHFTVTKKSSRLPLYADIFRSGENSPLLSVDTGSGEFNFEADQGGIYVLRLQPELFTAGEYLLSVAVGPSLDFPVSGKKAAVGSTWGDQRDGGKRSHEGIDIFAPKLTPAVAAADGTVVGVREGGIGGKVVWLRPEGKAYTLYYAHLDRQLVQEGQRVKKGDVVGLVGNTGNAQYTPAHLHFGVYGFGGAIDPLPFVNRTTKTAAAITDKKLTTQLKLKKAQKLRNGETIRANAYLVPLAAAAQGYVAEGPDGQLLQVPFDAVQITKVPVGRQDGVAVKATEPSRKS